jgi:hypothetical protein
MNFLPFAFASILSSSVIHLRRNHQHQYRSITPHRGARKLKSWMIAMVD